MINTTLLASDLKDLSIKLNKIPTKKEYKQQGKYDIKTLIKYFGSFNNALMSTFGKVNTKTRQPNVEIKCNNCGKEIIINHSGYICSENHFCSKSCAATFNNKKKPKRKKTKKCRDCNNLVCSNLSFCNDCIQDGKHLKTGFRTNKTIAYYIGKKNDANRYSQIREDARRTTKDRPKKCVVCGYDKHTEVCHIKEIKKFDPNTLLSVVNDPNNLILLCRNHHWEMDHGLLVIS